MTRHDREVVHQSGGRDLLVEFMVRVGDSQAAPYLRCYSHIEKKRLVLETICQPSDRKDLGRSLAAA